VGTAWQLALVNRMARLSTRKKLVNTEPTSYQRMQLFVRLYLCTGEFTGVGAFKVQSASLRAGLDGAWLTALDSDAEVSTSR
jgi:hypothetical protein